MYAKVICLDGAPILITPVGTSLSKGKLEKDKVRDNFLGDYSTTFLSFLMLFYIYNTITLFYILFLKKKSSLDCFGLFWNYKEQFLRVFRITFMSKNTIIINCFFYYLFGIFRHKLHQIIRFFDVGKHYLFLSTRRKIILLLE